MELMILKDSQEFAFVPASIGRDTCQSESRPSSEIGSARNLTLDFTAGRMMRNKSYTVCNTFLEKLELTNTGSVCFHRLLRFLVGKYFG